MVHTVGFSLFIFSKVAPHPTHRFQFDLSELHKAESRHVRIVRVFLELYIDGFGVFHKKSYTPDAIYMTFGNQTRSTRNKLENIWCLGIKPPNTSIHDCLKAFIQDVKRLQHGFYTAVAGEQIFVIGGIGLVKADMPQANELAGCQHQLATKPCRMCLVTYGSDLADASFDSSLHSRSFWEAAKLREMVASGDKKALEKTGMSTTQSVFEDPALDFDATHRVSYA